MWEQEGRIIFRVLVSLVAMLGEKSGLQEALH